MNNTITSDLTQLCKYIYCFIYSRFVLLRTRRRRRRSHHHCRRHFFLNLPHLSRRKTMLFIAKLIKMVLLWRNHYDVTFFSDIMMHSRYFCDVIRHSRHSSLTSLDIPYISVTSCDVIYDVCDVVDDIMRSGAKSAAISYYLQNG